MKTLTLDCSKWRCGDDGKNRKNRKNRLGKGCTFLLNDYGKECCLGQFSPQLNPQITKKQLLGLGNPSDLGKKIPLLAFKRDNAFCDTILSQKAIGINDNPTTTISEKIKSLRNLFKKVGYTIRVINKPKNAK